MSQRDFHAWNYADGGHSDLLNIRVMRCSVMVEKGSLPHERPYPDLKALLQFQGSALLQFQGSFSPTSMLKDYFIALNRRRICMCTYA